MTAHFAPSRPAAHPEDPALHLTRGWDISPATWGHSSERTKSHAKGWARPGTSAGGLLFASWHSGLAAVIPR